MTHLNIQQGLNVEVVSTNLIKKLYEAALSVPEPLEGELDAAYLSGNLLVDKSYRALVEYLTNRFDDLHINVTDSYYIPFEDSAVLNVLLANNIGSDGIGVTEAEAANAAFTSNTFKNNTTITSFNEFPYFTKANTNPPTSLFEGCSNLEEIDLTSVTTTSQYEFRSSGIKTANLPSLTSLGVESFAYCSNLETVTDLGNVTSIPNYCFRNNPKLSSVVLPTTVTSLGIMAFSNYNSGFNSVLTTITGLNNVGTFGSLSLCEHKSLNLDASLISSATYVGAGAFSWVPMTGVLNLKNLAQINGEYAFYNGKYNKIQCLGKISTIPGRTFMGNTTTSDRNLLTEVYLPYECTSIGQSAFEGRINLTTIKQYTQSVDNWIEGETPTYGDITRVTSFGNNCFYNCTSLTISPSDIANATSIGENAFYGCNLGAVVLPNVSSLTHRSFNNCGVTSFDISGSSITNIALLDLVTGNQLTSVKLPTTVTAFGSTYGITFNSKNITELRGVLGITTIYSSNWNNILNPLPLLSLLTSDKFIITTNMGSGLVFTASCPQAYLPVFKYCTKTTITKPTLAGYNNPESTFFQNYTSLKMPIGLLYFKDLEYIRPFMFYGVSVTSLIINNTTCPTFNTTGMTYTNQLDTYMSDFTDWSTKPFGNMSTAAMTIYVPNNAVSTYQADSNYNSYTILGIGSLNSGVIYATEDDWVAANKPNGLIAEYLGLNTADLASFVSANNLTYWTNPNS